MCQDVGELKSGHSEHRLETGGPDILLCKDGTIHYVNTSKQCHRCLLNVSGVRSFTSEGVKVVTGQVSFKYVWL